VQARSQSYYQVKEMHFINFHANFGQKKPEANGFGLKSHQFGDGGDKTVHEGI
jgi:hypothetical protein